MWHYKCAYYGRLHANTFIVTTSMHIIVAYKLVHVALHMCTSYSPHITCGTTSVRIMVDYTLIHSCVTTSMHIIVDYKLVHVALHMCTSYSPHITCGTTSVHIITAHTLHVLPLVCILL